MEESKIIYIVIFIISYIIIFGSPLVLTALNLINLFRKKQYKPNTVEACIMIAGSIQTISLFGMLGSTEYNKAIILVSIGITSKWHTPLASSYLLTIRTLIILGLIGYLVIRKFKSKLPPLLFVMCISCMMIGSFIGVIWMIQISPHMFQSVDAIPCAALYFCLFPFNYIIYCIVITKKVIKEYTSKEQEKHYNNKILAKCNLILQNSRNWPIFAIILMIPILAITLIILILYGQQPDAVIKAFTETSDWLLSQKISPPPIHPKGSHYLCTVSLRGHRRIVKPLRYGIRGNEKIVVNRQLCIANAFEQLIQERTPKIHHFIRYIYDKYGYPLSKHIINPVSADIVYIFMKPLEWLFLVILYLFDKKPENRIAIQYLPF